MTVPPADLKKVEIRTTSGKEYSGYITVEDYNALAAVLNPILSGSTKVAINSHEDPSNQGNYAQVVNFRNTSIESVEDV